MQPCTKAIPCMCLADLLKTVVSVFPDMSLLWVTRAKRHFSDSVMVLAGKAV